MWEKFKEHGWNWYGILGWLIILAGLILIKLRGSVVIYEDIKPILNIELIIVIIIILLGIGRDIKDWRK